MYKYAEYKNYYDIEIINRFLYIGVNFIVIYVKLFKSNFIKKFQEITCFKWTKINKIESGSI